MTLNLPLLYVLWLEEYCQISPNKKRSPNLWHVTSIFVCCIFGCSRCNIWHKKRKIRLFWQDFFDHNFNFFLFQTFKRVERRHIFYEITLRIDFLAIFLPEYSKNFRSTIKKCIERMPWSLNRDKVETI